MTGSPTDVIPTERSEGASGAPVVSSRPSDRRERVEGSMDLAFTDRKVATNKYPFVGGQAMMKEVNDDRAQK